MSYSRSETFTINPGLLNASIYFNIAIKVTQRKLSLSLAIVNGNYTKINVRYLCILNVWKCPCRRLMRRRSPQLPKTNARDVHHACPRRYGCDNLTASLKDALNITNAILN